MASMSFVEIIVFLLSPLVSPATAVPDLLGFVEPRLALETLGEPTEDAALLELVRGDGSEEVGTAPPLSPEEREEVERAIQNLASRDDPIREKARDRLVAAGAAVRPRLEEVVSSDARRAGEARRVLESLGSATARSAHYRNVVRILAVRLAAGGAARESTELRAAIGEAAASPSLFLRQAARAALSNLARSKNDGAAPTPAVAQPLDASKTPGVVTGSEAVGTSAALGALPVDTRLLVSVTISSATIGGDSPWRLDHVLSPGGAAASGPFAPTPEQLSQARRRVTRGILDFVLAYGNIRPDRVSIVNVGAVGPRGHGFAFLLEGAYEPEVLAAGLVGEDAGFERSEVSGTPVFSASSLAIALVSDNLVLLAPSESSHFALSEYLSRLAAGDASLAGVARWKQFLGTLEASHGLRGLALTDRVFLGELHEEIANEGLPEGVHEAVVGLEEVELTSAPQPNGDVALRLEGRFREARHAEALVDFLAVQIETGVREMGALVERPGVPPIVGRIHAALQGLRVVAEQRRGILRLAMAPLGPEELSSLVSGWAIAAFR